MSDMQWIADSVKTPIEGRPSVFVYQNSGQNAWLHADANGWLALGPLVSGTWSIRLEDSRG